MSKARDKKVAARAGGGEAGRGMKPIYATSGRSPKSSQSRAGEAKFEAIMKAAERAGLLNEKSSRIGGRVSSMLVAQAKKLTGIEADTDLIEFALASVALEDKFAGAFRKSRGKVDEDLKLGF